MEPRMRPRQKGQQFSTADLEAYLVAFGDDEQPLDETVKVLDEIVTDYIIETCHAAAQSASYSRRSKIKVDDFKFVLRRDPAKLGRVLELHSIQREIKTKKRMFEVDEKRLGRDAAAKEVKELQGKKEVGEKDKDGNDLISGILFGIPTSGGGGNVKSVGGKDGDVDLNEAIVAGVLEERDEDIDVDELFGADGSDEDEGEPDDSKENRKKKPRIV